MRAPSLWRLRCRRISISKLLPKKNISFYTRYRAFLLPTLYQRTMIIPQATTVVLVHLSCYWLFSLESLHFCSTISLGLYMLHSHQGSMWILFIWKIFLWFCDAFVMFNTESPPSPHKPVYFVKHFEEISSPFVRLSLLANAKNAK